MKKLTIGTTLVLGILVVFNQSKPAPAGPVAVQGTAIAVDKSGL